MAYRKRLVICCDGTWNDADSAEDFTNVTRIARAILPNDTRGPSLVPQIVYYHAGVGTTGGVVDQMIGGAIGLGLSRNVRDAYAFLAHNYCEGDEIFLFGFSRGAYTVRSVAGLIGWAGLLHKRDMDDFATLWEGYRRKSEPGIPDARARFPDRHAPVPVQCLGVFDTVGSLGIPGNLDAAFAHFYQFHDTELGPHVAHAFQALALDERRVDFAPAIWFQAPDAPASQELRQMWFAGAHSDVGGGYNDHGLSDIALAWMAGQVDPLLAIDEDYLALRQDRRTCWGMGAVHDSASGLIWQARGTQPRRPFAAPGRTGERLHQSVALRLAPEDGCPDPLPLPPALRGLELTPRYAPLNDMEVRLRWPPSLVRSPAPPAPPPATRLGAFGRILKDMLPG
ncbi:DUF2235 domain-containing protein [Siccirubricoccus sp. KC 17139]|uniref:DUF2235 domain-containing protein n=1 Tax=Siccirubricoccus soli TaxID=2899147 RepID=A0ABT1D976_9PROT|nr:DUF2235 domain-containing protein [Siccirubricoccus soli]MCO6418482.1 DUF2235 domain-containing protein [Siccirubricoccus soli]MCP2684617.1 DUF2235 domain-containing protein [Siccirubricoccus soli]